MTRAPNASATLFSPRLDAVYFSLHAIFFLLMIAMTFGILDPVRWDQMTVRMIVAFVFFNTLHTVLTWIGLILLPEARRWVVAQLKLEGSTGKLRRWTVATVFLGITWTVAEVFVLKWQSDSVRLTLSLLLAILTAFHNVGQTKGLALIQTHRIQASKSDALWERRLFVIFVISIFLGSLKLLLNRHLKTFIPDWWTASWFGISLVIFLGLAILAYRHQRSFFSKKFWFTTTAVYHPLLLLSPVAFVFQRALHGVEYLFLSIGMTKRSSVKWGLGAWSLLVAALLLTGVAKVAVLKTWPPLSDLLSAEWLQALIFFGIWVEFTHYYLDSILFRFQDSTVRENVGPLLKA